MLHQCIHVVLVLVVVLVSTTLMSAFNTRKLLQTRLRYNCDNSESIKTICTECARRDIVQPNTFYSPCCAGTMPLHQTCIDEYNERNRPDSWGRK